MHLAFIMMLRRELCVWYYSVAEGAERCWTAEQVHYTQGQHQEVTSTHTAGQLQDGHEQG